MSVVVKLKFPMKYAGSEFGSLDIAGLAKKNQAVAVITMKQ